MQVKVAHQMRLVKAPDRPNPDEEWTRIEDLSDPRIVVNPLLKHIKKVNRKEMVKD